MLQLLKRNDRVQVASHVRQIGGSGGLRFSKENREREKAVREKITVITIVFCSSVHLSICLEIV